MTTHRQSPTRRDPSRLPSLPRRILLAAALLWGLASPSTARAAAGGENGPLAQLKRSNDRIDKLLREKKTGEDPVKNDEIKSIVNGFLDYEELAKRSLAQHWDPLSATQREDFVKTLRSLIEKNYVKQLRSNLDYEIAYKSEAITDGEAGVSTTVKVRTKGKSTDTNIDYKLKQRGAKWMVFDVITDDVSMVRNYKAQFNKIITTESFDALVKKMRDRVAQADEAEAPPK